MATRAMVMAVPFGIDEERRHTSTSDASAMWAHKTGDDVGFVGKVRWIDLSCVHLLEPRLLKQDRFAIAKVAPWLNFSKEKLAQTLDKFGVRIRPSRRRSSLALITKLPRSPLHGD